MQSALRRFARSIRHLPDRVLHPLRHRVALGQLRRRRAPASLLVVCHGNICRSPYAAAALAAALPASLRQSIRITSAGFIGEGRPAPREAIAVAAGLGIDLTHHRSRPLSAQLVGAAQLVIVMDTDQQREIMQRYGRRAEDILILGDLDPDPIDTRTIRDPVEQAREVFEATYARIDRCISQLVKAIGGRTSRTSGRL